MSMMLKLPPLEKVVPPPLVLPMAGNLAFIELMSGRGYNAEFVLETLVIGNAIAAGLIFLAQLGKHAVKVDMASPGKQG